MPNNLEIASETTAYLELALSKFKDRDIATLKDATNHALSLHAEQARRPSGETYGNHILRVAARLPNDFGVVDKELFIAGLYHDAVEDQLGKLCESGVASRDTAYAYLSNRYSGRVAEAVKGVSNPEELEDIQDREKRNSEYIAHVIEECDKNSDCLVIKLSDFFDNAMRIQYNLTEADKIRGGKKYLPLFDYFYGQLEHGIEGIDQDTRRILQKRISAQRDYIKQII